MTPHRLLAALKARLPRGPLVLLYHRVAALDPDPQLLCVTPAHFAAQLRVLRGTLPPLTLAEAARGTRGFAVTFDDGYADNLRAALPVLEEARVPATVFVCSGKVGSAGEFWWDELERLLLGPGSLPPRLRLDLGSWEGIEEQSAPAPGWDITKAEDPSNRHKAYRALTARLKPLPPAGRERVLEALRAWAGRAPDGRPSHRALTPDGLRELSASPLVEVGGHTPEHSLLAGLPEEEQFRLVAEDRAALERLAGRAPESFAYPYGTAADYDEASVRAVRRAGYARACANEPGRVGRRADPYRLPRFLVRDWDAAEFEARLRGFLAT